MIVICTTANRDIVCLVFQIKTIYNCQSLGHTGCDMLAWLTYRDRVFICLPSRSLECFKFTVAMYDDGWPEGGESFVTKFCRCLGSHHVLRNTETTDITVPVPFTRHLWENPRNVFYIVHKSLLQISFHF